MGAHNVQVAGSVETIIQGNYIADPHTTEESRPSFQVLGGSVDNSDQVFAPGRIINQFKGDTVDDIQWRWAGPAFEMPWRQVSGYQLEKQLLKWGLSVADILGKPNGETRYVYPISLAWGMAIRTTPVPTEPLAPPRKKSAY